MRFSRQLLALVLVGAAACGPTYVVQSTPVPVTQRAPEPPRVEPLQVNIVRPEEGRILVQTSRPSYLAVFEIVPGRGVSLVYPRPAQPRDVLLNGLAWVNVYWTMRYDFDRRFASSDTRYIYAVASDTPLRVDDADYDRSHLERRLGSTFYSSSPNATVRAISREFVRAQPDEYWSEDMFTMALAPSRVMVAIRWARVYCPGGGYFEVREEVADHIFCPSRNTNRGRPVTIAPDSVFASNGRRVPRHMDPTARTPIFRVPAPTDVGQQQGQPQTPPRTQPPTYPRTQPTNPQTPTNQPPQTQPPQNQPPQNPPQDQNTNDKDHENNGRRAHGDPRNSDPRGNGNGYGNGGREQPSTQPPPTNPPTPPSLPTQSNPQPQQQGQPQTQPGNNGRGNGNANGQGNTNANGQGNGSANSGNDHGLKADDAKPTHNDAPKNRFDAMMQKVKKQDDKKDDKKAASDSTKKP
jgi:hypothetical protein